MMTQSRRQTADPIMQFSTPANEETLFTQLTAAPPAPTQPLRMAPANPEKVKRDRVLKTLAATNKRCLAWLRSRLAELYWERYDKQGYELARVTADDGRILIKAHPEFSQLTKMNFMGALFKSKEFEPTGEYMHSQTEGGNANRLTCWRHIGPDPRTPAPRK